MKRWDAYYRMKINERLRLGYEKRLQEKKTFQINSFVNPSSFFSVLFSLQISFSETFFH